MTFVGKILVIVIMAFSLLFLALSTVVFTTSRNWMVATKKEQEEVDKLKKKIQDAQAVAEAAKKGLEDAKVAFAAESPRSSIAPLANLKPREQARHRPAHGGPQTTRRPRSRRPRARSTRSKTSGSRRSCYAPNCRRSRNRRTSSNCTRPT